MTGPAYIKPKALEMEMYMGVPCETIEFELEEARMPGMGGTPSNADPFVRYSTKMCDFDDVSKASRNLKVFQEKPFYDATVGHLIVSDTMRKNRLKGEYDHPPRNSGKERIGTVDRSRACHTIHRIDFRNKAAYGLFSTSGPYGPTVARDILLNGEVPACSIRLFSSSRKVVDRARGVRMSMGPYRYITTDNVMSPSNETADAANGLGNTEALMAMIGKKIAVDTPAAVIQGEMESIIEIANDMLFEGSDDVRFATEYLGLELEGFDGENAIFKDGEYARAFMKVDDVLRNATQNALRAGCKFL